MPERVVDDFEGRVQCAHRKAAIIGAGTLRAFAPWDDPTWCVWGLNEIWQPRMDRHFELHPRAVQSAADFAGLASLTLPCYLLDPAEWRRGEVRQPVRYPLDRVLAATRGRRYFTCTFAYQVALALADGFTEIGLWGVDLDLGSARERLIEKACVEYWLGLAEGRGITVTMPPTTTLLRRPHLYGYDYHDEKRSGERTVADFPRPPADTCALCVGIPDPRDPCPACKGASTS